MTTMQHRMVAASIGPMLVPVPNVVMDGDGFYVSYNDHDISVYGCDTTALVWGQMQKFYILKGDHRDQYSHLIGQGFDACLSYFKDHMQDAHNHSDKLTA